MVEFKKYVTSTAVFEVVIGKLYHWQETCPIILFPIYKGTKVSFYCAVLLFCLAVCLRLEHAEVLSLDAKEVTERALKLRRENRSSITNDGVRKAVILHHYVYNHFY